MSKEHLKIAVIGGGSSYTPELIEGLLTRKDELPVGEIWLVDIVEGYEKVQVIANLAKRMIKKVGSEAKVYATLNRKEALLNADFVCSQFRSGGLEARIRDEKIAIKYDMIGQETNGLGGFTNACRTIPIALEIAEEMETLCPNAWLLNFTNPSGMVTEAILKYTKVKAVGLCNIPVNMERGAANMLGVPKSELTMQIAGLNHFVFATKAMHNGEDQLPRLIHEMLNGNDQMTPKNIPPFDWPRVIVESLGIIPCAYLRYYYMSRDIIEEEIHEAKRANNRGEVVKRIEKEIFEVYSDPNLDVKPAILEERGGAYYSEAACELMSSIHNDKRTIMHVNTRNNGAIQGLPDDCAVEVSSIITSTEIIPLSVEPFAPDTLALIQLMKQFETLTVEAAVEGDIAKAYRALVLNPIVDTGSHLDEALEETVRENLQFLPLFAHVLEK
ncbi:6-phospho-beta-glucosidase [Vibrio panuliri]|uniref:6-phospho-beta-glucosidase n=1 Tax=Vibrio panuliri TaxID=1381081 RepID=A0ABX3FIN9_9VIBR|nr:6-phospho-beta-glucosidase [Vibrio panuliri]KAB1460865.1 6-phospho-beta-glucosidase [Vibrio panuliri]OLQ91670.1 6-phospho-beta-glucosidase [Vibrio panuliri]